MSGYIALARPTLACRPCYPAFRCYAAKLSPENKVRHHGHMDILNNSSHPWSWIALTAGLFVGLVTNILWARLTTLLPSLANDQTQKLDGVWLARVRYANVPGRKGLEILRIREQFGSLFIYKEHYNSNHRAPVRLRGAGIFRGGMASAYFYHDEKNAYASGTMTFRQSSTDYGPPVLVGVYTQIIDREGETKGPLMEPYNLVRIQLPYWQQLKRLVGRTYFENYDDIESFVEDIPQNVKKYL